MASVTIYLGEATMIPAFLEFLRETKLRFLKINDKTGSGYVTSNPEDVGDDE